MSNSDFNYSETGGMFALFPNNEKAREAYQLIAAKLGPKMFMHEFKSVRADLRRAGYSVTKAKPVTESDDELLAALSA
jgi:hypothetical protein